MKTIVQFVLNFLLNAIWQVPIAYAIAARARNRRSSITGESFWRVWFTPLVNQMPPCQAIAFACG